MAERKKIGDFVFFKSHPDNKIWSVEHVGYDGEVAVSFDKQHILYLFKDYPYNFTKEQKELFDKEYPNWAEFFDERC